MEVIGFVIGSPTKIRVERLKDRTMELRSDLTQDNITLVKY